MTTATDVYGALSLDDVDTVMLRRFVNPDGTRTWMVERTYRSQSLVPGIPSLEVRYVEPCTPSVVSALEALIHDEVLVVDAPKMQRDLAPA